MDILMTNSQKLCIQKLFFEVEINTPDCEQKTPYEWQEHIKGMFYSDLLFVLENTLNRISVEKGYSLCIDKLSLDLGEINEEDIRRILPERLEQILPEAINRPVSQNELHSNNLKAVSMYDKLMEVFNYFLSTGSLPWSFQLPEGKNLEQTLLASWQEEKSYENIFYLNQQVIKTIASPIAQKRLSLQFSHEFHKTLLYRLSPGTHQIILLVLEKLQRAELPQPEWQIFENILWEVSFAQVAKSKIMNETHMVGMTWHSLPVTTAKHASFERLLEYYWPGATQSADIRRMPSRIPGIGTEDLSSANPREPEPGIRQMKTPVTSQADMFEAGFSSEKKIKYSEVNPLSDEIISSSEGPGSLQIKHPEEDEGIYIENAGLVILHPFLPRFFEALGIASGDKLIQPDRALYLLHFLTTGQPVAPEYELVLPKVFCNIPLTFPVDTDIQLSNAEEDEVSALLRAVISHWEALRNTTPDGLRVNFLMRPGKLSLRDDADWLLHVESKIYDILLEHLPWGISLIKLPWMTRKIWVEWR